MKTKYYSPKLDRALISPLYHAAKAEGIPMTKLASRWVAERLATLPAGRIIAQAPGTN